MLKKWWFWAIIAVIVIAVVFGAGGEEEDSASTPKNSSEQAVTNAASEVKESKYEYVSLKTMLDELEANAMKAEATYQNKYVQVEGKITNFDSDGEYISIKPTGAGEWDYLLLDVTCYIKTDAQRNVLIKKAKGDIVTIKGKITRIGEVLGYSIDIDEVK